MAKTTSNFVLDTVNVWTQLPATTTAFSGENSKDIYYKFGNGQTSGYKLSGIVMCDSAEQVWVMTISSTPTTLVVTIG